MYRLSLIIGEIYHQFLPLTKNGKISLNLDFSDTTIEVPDPDEIRQALTQALDSAFQRTQNSAIDIVVTNSEITITDQGTILSKTACALLSRGRIHVKSRIGFGTTVHISLRPAEPTTTTEPVVSIETPEQPTQTEPAEPAQPAQQPRSARSTISKRTINAAAKRADKKVKKIVEKAQKRSQKSTQRRTTKPALKKPHKKVVHKLDLS